MTISLPQYPQDVDVEDFSQQWLQLDVPLEEITQTAIGTFTTCQQKFAFHFIYRLRRNVQSMALTIGTAMHAGLEVLLAAGDTPIEERLQPALAAVDAVFERLTDDLAVINDDKVQTSWAQALALVEGWYIINGGDAETWTFVHTELTCRRRANSNETVDRMAGKLDGLVIADGRYWFPEHKSRSSLRNFNADDLLLDNQLLWYLLLCKRDLPMEQVPVGALYNIVVKPLHRIGKGTRQELARRMVQAMVESPDKYFNMQPIEIDDQMLEQARARFERIVEHMDRLEMGNIMQSTNRCDDFGGCQYKVLCQAGADANSPATVFEAPGIDLFHIIDQHNELAAPAEESEETED